MIGLLRKFGGEFLEGLRAGAGWGPPAEEEPEEEGTTVYDGLADKEAAAAPEPEPPAPAAAPKEEPPRQEKPAAPKAIGPYVIEELPLVEFRSRPTLRCDGIARTVKVRLIEGHVVVGDFCSNWAPRLSIHLNYELSEQHEWALLSVQRPEPYRPELAAELALAAHRLAPLAVEGGDMLVAAPGVLVKFGMPPWGTGDADALAVFVFVSKAVDGYCYGVVPMSLLPGAHEQGDEDLPWSARAKHLHGALKGAVSRRAWREVAELLSKHLLFRTVTADGEIRPEAIFESRLRTAVMKDFAKIVDGIRIV